MNKIKSTIVLTILLATTFTAFLPIAIASTGIITFVPTGVQNIAAGSIVTLNFATVTFSGGQFYLVWSADGFSQISSGDYKYSPTMNTADLFAGTTKNYTSSLGNFTVGNSKIVGPIPKEIAGGRYYIKAFDGSATSVAVTNNYIQVLPSFEVIPSKGAGGTPIVLNGYAFSSNTHVNLTYYDPIAAANKTLAIVLTNAIGKFTYASTAKDLVQALGSGEHPKAFNVITFYANDTTTGYQAKVLYSEGQRGLLQVGDMIPLAGDMFGNNTMFTSLLAVNVHVTDSLIIAGNYFRPTSVSIWWESARIGTPATNSSGFFNTTVTVPITTIGSHKITIKDAGTNFMFNITVLPTLLLVPSSGPVNQQVRAYAYGFPANQKFYIYWFEKTFGEGTFYNFNNATTGSNGQFNITVQFKVPHTYGGSHQVDATTSFLGKTTATMTSVEASTSFDVTPTQTLSTLSFKNDGSLITITGTGFDPRLSYVANIDNNYLGVDGENYTFPSNIIANKTGDLSIKFVAAGFEAGMHVFSIYTQGQTTPMFLLFTVTGTSPDTDTIMAQLTTNQNALTNQLTSISTAQTQMNSSISTSISSISTLLSTSVTNIRTDIAGVKSDVAGVKSAVGTLSSDVSSKIDSLGTSLGNQITSQGTTLGKSITDNANSITTAIQSEQATSSSVKTAVDGLSTYLIVIAIIAIIVLVIEIAILIRRLS